MKKNSHIPVCLFLLLIAVGILVRMICFELMEFKADEVEAILLTKYWLKHGVPQFGLISGIGIRNPPGFVFLLIPIIFFTSSPLSVGLCVVAFNIAALFLIYRLGVALDSPWAGLWACAFMAVHPWLVLYSRKIWAQSLLPFFIVLLLLVLARCSRISRSRTVFWVAPLASVIGQIHYSGYCVAVFLLVWLAVQALGRRVNWTAAWAGLLVGLILFLPYIFYITRTNFADLNYAVRLIFGERGEVSRNGLWLVALWGKTAFAGGLAYPFISEALPLSRSPLGAAMPWLNIMAVTSTALVLLLAGAGVLLPEKKKEVGSTLARFGRWLFIFTAVPVVMYLARGRKIPPHYYIISIPPVLMLAGLGLEKLKRELAESGLFRGRLSSLPSITGFLVIVYGAVIWLSFILYLNRTGGTGGDYGLTYRVQEAAAEILVEEKIDPARVDACLTRDNSIGVSYLISILPGGEGPYSNRRARLVDTFLFEGQGCTAGEVSAGKGPLEICISNR